MAEYKITRATHKDYIHQILALQRANLKSALTTEEIKREGFVTCEHDIDLLVKMNQPDQHIISLFKDQVVGYCLVMSPIWRNELEVLKSMFDKIESTKYKNNLISPDSYIVVGQVCIHKDHRKKSLLRKMYQHYKECLSPSYQYCITEIATSNVRSLHAHEANGFKHLLSYKSEDGKSWELVIWDWSEFN